MKAIVNGKILLPDSILEGHALLFDQSIRGIVPLDALPADAERIDAQGNYVSPGLVDIHIHGYLGEDASDGSAEGIVKMAEGVAKNGVTSFLPTTMTVSMGEIEKALDVIRALKKESEKDSWQGAQILGVHAEGPFINPAKKGAQAADHIRRPEIDFALRNADILRILTMAPEMEDGIGFLQAVSSQTDILLSLGHTGASYEQALAAFRNGARHATHTFNAMTALNHRDPGVVGAVLTEPVTAELICDAFHIHPGLFPLLASVKGERLILITDCTRGGGLSDGEYTLGGQPIFVNGVQCLLADGTIAGSVLKLNNAVRNMAAYGKVPLYTAVAMASRNPARAIGQTNKGTLEVGKDADIAIADPDFQIKATYLRGRRIY